MLDITRAYWSIKLDNESSLLTIFSTSFRLPFEISASSDKFQSKCDDIFEGLAGVTNIVEDMLIYGSTIRAHDENLRNVLNRVHEKGIQFNPDKCTPV